jgi:hypothetical protein
MKSDLRKRLDRLEAQTKADTKNYDIVGAVMAIVSFHSGKLSARAWPSMEIIESLEMTSNEQAIDPDDVRTIWRRTREKLNDLIASRGGTLISEGDEFILRTLRDGDDRRSSFAAVDELYQEIPADLKEKFELLPYLADYLV